MKKPAAVDGPIAADTAVVGVSWSISPGPTTFLLGGLAALVSLMTWQVVLVNQKADARRDARDQALAAIHRDLIADRQREQASRQEVLASTLRVGLDLNRVGSALVDRLKDMPTASDAATSRAIMAGLAERTASITSYDRGINGVMVDVSNLPEGVTLTPADLEVGGDGTPPASVAVRRGAGVDGSDRVTLTWPDYNPLTDPPVMAVGNGWLRATVKANANTGLSQPDVFSFGSVIGETGDGTGSSGWRVTALDLSAVKRAINAPTALASTTDFNRDGRTNALDLPIVRRALNQALPLPTAPAAFSHASLVRSVAEELGLVS